MTSAIQNMRSKERLGHSSITLTIDTYGGLFPALDERLADGLDATFRASLPNLPRPGRGLRLVTDSGEGDPHTPSPARSMVGLPGLEPGTFGPPDRNPMRRTTIPTASVQVSGHRPEVRATRNDGLRRAVLRSVCHSVCH